MRFSDIPGQELIKNQLLTSIHNKMLSHSLLFIGHEGFGGLALALALATYLNCEKPQNNDSCGVCSSCNKADKLIHPDIHFTFPTITDDSGKAISCLKTLPAWRETILENPYFTSYDWMNKLKAGNKQGKIYIEECHQIVKNVSLTAFENKAKVQIIWSAENMGLNANALLKLIEEPSPGTYFIFLCTDRNKMLSTILSRSRNISLPRFSMKDIRNELKKFNQSNDEILDEIAGLAGGNLHEAYRLIKEGNINYLETLANWLRACYMLEKIKIYKITSEISDLGREKVKDFLQYAIRIFRESMLVSYNLNELNQLSSSEHDFVGKFSKLITANNIMEITEAISRSSYYVERNANIKFVIFNLSLQLNNLLYKG